MNSVRLYVLPVMGFILSMILQLGYAQNTVNMAPSPAPAQSSDGAAIDQGIAYILLLVALAVTYLVH